MKKHGDYRDNPLALHVVMVTCCTSSVVSLQAFHRLRYPIIKTTINRRSRIFNCYQGHAHTMIKHQLLNKDSVYCNTCVLGHICVPQGLSAQDAARLNELVKERIRIPKGTLFFKAGDRLTALYGIRSGSMKLQLENESGHMQITGFVFAGEIIGLDALAENVHVSNAIAMEDTEVCVIRMNDLSYLSKEIPALAYRVTRLMSQEISRSHSMVLSLGAMRSEQRLAAFLINLSQRFACLGYSGSEYVLRMSREEIAIIWG